MVFWRKKSIMIIELTTVTLVLSSIAAVSFLHTDEQATSHPCPETHKLFCNSFFVDAVSEQVHYIVKITYSDNSKMTSLVILEILGMEETFHKEFSQQSFVEIVQFDSVPKYGWLTMPVTFFLEHEELGLVGLKTEIHPYDEPKPKVIYSKISHSDWSKLASLKPES